MSRWRVEYRFIAGSELGKWNTEDFDDIHSAVYFAKSHLFEGDEIRMFDLNLKPEQTR